MLSGSHTHSPIQVGHTSPDDSFNTWESHRHYLFSPWPKMCHDVICSGQIEDWSKLLGFSYLRCDCVTDTFLTTLAAAVNNKTWNNKTIKNEENVEGTNQRTKVTAQIGNNFEALYSPDFQRSVTSDFSTVVVSVLFCVWNRHKNPSSWSLNSTVT